MLRELLRPRHESRSKGLVKQRDLDNINFLSEHSTHPASYIQNSFLTNSKRGLETSNNPNSSLKPNSNATNQSNSNNNVATESYCLPSSAYSMKDKANSGALLGNNINIITKKASSNFDGKEEPQICFTSNTHQSPLVASQCRSSSQSTNRLKTLDSYIAQIKHNVYDKSKPVIRNKSQKKDLLQNNVEILASNVRTVHRESKANGQLNKGITKENERLVSTGEMAIRDTYFMNKELPYLRNEIDEMKSLIAQHNEETKYIRNDSMKIERETLLIKDEIKKTNGQMALILKQKEKFSNAIVVLCKHIETTKEKIEKQERLSDELMTSVQVLLAQSSHVFDYIKL